MDLEIGGFLYDKNAKSTRHQVDWPVNLETWHTGKNGELKVLAVIMSNQIFPPRPGEFQRNSVVVMQNQHNTEVLYIKLERVRRSYPKGERV